MLRNLLTSQLWQQGGIIALLKWDSNLFENVTFQDGIDKDTAIDYILMNAGKTPLVHPDPEYMNYYMGTWAKIRGPIWEKLLLTTTIEYDMLDNTNITTEYTDTEESEHTQKRTDTGNSTLTGTNTTSGTIEGQVSAENASTYQPDSNEIRDLTDTTNQETEASNNRDETNNNSRTLTHSERRKGKIGDGMIQRMIDAERVTANYSVYDTIVSDFVEQFCLKLFY